MVSADVCNSISNGNKDASDAGLILKCKVTGIRGYCVTKRLEIRLIREAFTEKIFQRVELPDVSAIFHSI